MVLEIVLYHFLLLLEKHNAYQKNVCFLCAVHFCTEGILALNKWGKLGIPQENQSRTLAKLQISSFYTVELVFTEGVK